MISKLLKATVIIAALLFVNVAILAPSPTYAANDVCNSKVPASVKKAAGCKGNSDDLQKNITNILNAIIGIAGLVAVVFVVIGGIQYMTSTGDAAKVQKAKNTILYALIGLVICALAFAITNFAIHIIYTKN